MSNTKTVFISGFTLGMHEEDHVVILGLTDGIVPEAETTYNFALPKTVFKNLVDHLNDINGELAIDIETNKKELKD